MLFQKQTPLSLVSCEYCKVGSFLQTRRYPECASLPVGYMIREKFLYFGEPMTRYHIALRRARRILSLFEAIGAGIFTLGFFGLFLFQVLQGGNQSDFLTMNFWFDNATAAPFLFWLSGVSLCFFIYRLIDMRRRSEEVDIRAFTTEEQKDPKPQQAPSAEEMMRLSKRKKKDIARTFTKDAREVVEKAYLLADKNGSDLVLAEHIFISLLQNDTVASIFVRLGFPVSSLRTELERALPKRDVSVAPRISKDAAQILFYSYEYAYQAGQHDVNVTELLIATVRESEKIQEMLYTIGVEEQKLSNVIEWVRIRERLRKQFQHVRSAASHRNKYGLDRAMTAVATPFLNSFSTDLTMAAMMGRLAPVVARDKEFTDMFRVIEGGRQSVLLVGEQGVGKMSMIEGLVQRMIEDDVPKRLRDKRLIQLSTSTLLAGTTVSGAQERLIRMMNEITRAGNIILFIENIHNLMGGNEEAEGLDVSKTLSEFLTNQGIILFATTTPQGFTRHVSHSQIGGTMTRVEIAEMTENQAVQVLESRAGSIEYKHNVFFSYDAIEFAVRFAKRFLHDELLPESAVELIAEAASYARSKHGENTLVGKDDVAAIVHEKTGVPVTAISADESDKLLQLESVMHERMIGQSEAVSLVANALRRARAEIRSTKKPIASFLFLGPTGVGKTELAKTIAEVYFGGEDRMVRIDMSEYQDAGSIERMLGRTGEQGTGQLTEAVRERPFSLVLLDEMEKANKSILDLFLQVFDDGRLTDSVGRVIDFTNTIIIATSNAGTNYVEEQIEAGVTLENIRQSLMRKELKQYFRPEFLNRFDAIVLFRSLEKTEIRTIANLMLKRIAKDLDERGIGFEVTDAGLDALADAGFDPEFGARPMRRAIQDMVENKLAELILKNQVERRDTIVFDGKEMRVKKA